MQEDSRPSSTCKPLETDPRQLERSIQLATARANYNSVIVIDKARAETDRRRLQTSVSAVNIDEKLGSGNRNLLAVKDPLLLSLAGQGGRNSCPASGTIIFARGSPERGSHGERVLPGVPTWISDGSAGCLTPDASIKRC